MQAYGNYIDGKWVPAASGKTLENRNPADTTELIATFADSGDGIGIGHGSLRQRRH